MFRDDLAHFSAESGKDDAMSSEPDVSSDDSSPEPSTPAPAPVPPAETKFTRAAALWAALIAGFLILIVLLIFVAQNTTPTSVDFLSWTSPKLPLGVLILLAAVGGGLLTVLAGTARIVQLRRATKKLTARGKAR